MTTYKRQAIGLGAVLLSVLGVLFSGLGTTLVDPYIKRWQGPQVGPSPAPSATPVTPPADTHRHRDTQNGLTATPSGLEVRSDPEDAEVYIDWQLKGRTPVFLKSPPSRGFLVVAKEGYRPALRDVHASGVTRFIVPLSPDQSRQSSQALLFVSSESPDRICEGLRSELLQAGIEVLGAREAIELRRAIKAAGSIRHPGLRAWARATFETDYVLDASCRASVRDLSSQLSTSAPLQNATQGVVAAEVTVDLSIFDLRQGTTAPMVSRTVRDFALESRQAIQKALQQAVQDAAPALRERLSG
jgi:hypothetical protein